MGKSFLASLTIEITIEQRYLIGPPFNCDILRITIYPYRFKSTVVYCCPISCFPTIHLGNVIPIYS